MRPVPSGGWAAATVCRGWFRARQSFPPRRGPAEGSAKGISSEAEIACASRGLGGVPSSEAEFGSTAGEALEGLLRGAGPWAKRALGLFVPEEALAQVFWSCFVFFGDVLAHG